MEPRSLDDVRRLAARGVKMKFVYFWGHQPSASGKHVLSQWFERDFTEDGKTYRSAEHYMMAGKARLFGDLMTEARVLAAGHPREAKGMGRQVQPFDQAVWEQHRFEIVVRGSVAKFSDPELKEYLLGTGDRVLVEASPLDKIWASAWPPTTTAPPTPLGGTASISSASP